MSIKKYPVILLAIIILVGIGASCKKNTSSSLAASIASLDCASAVFAGSAVAGTAFTGTATIPYTGGNSMVYTAGTTVSSTGVTGLTATLQAGTLTSGTGLLSYNITGTPAAAGVATFAISFGGQACAITQTITSATTANCNTLTTTAAQVACLADAFKATLSASQVATLQISLTKANAIRWSNLPGGVTIRNGIEFSTLSATQLAAAKAVIAAAAGTTVNEGFSEFTQIGLADDVLGASASGYSSGKYIIAFLGVPSATGTWMLQFGGHHYAQNITYNNGATVSATPSHQGVEPRTFTASGTTYAPLSQEATVMADMLASFTTAELATAKLTSTFSDVLLGPNKDGQFPATKVGIKASTLTSAAQAKVIAAMLPWLNDLDENMKTTLLTEYTNNLGNTYVSYSGNAGATSGNAATFLTANADYVRIDGPGVWIELVCQSGVVFSGIHYHSIFRDHTRDYNGL